MAVGPTYVDGLTGQIDKDAVVELLDGPESITTADAASIITALVNLGLVTDDT